MEILVNTKKVVILQSKIWFHLCFTYRELKGNQVRILDRPAAVFPAKSLHNVSATEPPI